MLSFNSLFGYIHNAVNTLVDIYMLLVLAHFILTLAKVPANQWITLLASLVEPVLKPVRKLVTRLLPQKWQIIDWSPVALLLGITIARRTLELALPILF